MYFDWYGWCPLTFKSLKMTSGIWKQCWKRCSPAKRVRNAPFKTSIKSFVKAQPKLNIWKAAIWQKCTSHAFLLEKCKNRGSKGRRLIQMEATTKEAGRVKVFTCQQQTFQALQKLCQNAKEINFFSANIKQCIFFNMRGYKCEK